MDMRTILGGAAVASLIAAGALAHSGAKGVVKERMTGMGVMGKSVKALAPMMQGEISYDAEAVRSAAEQIGMHAGDALTGLFPEGSVEKPSEAKPAIWTNWEKFESLADELDHYSQGLALASVNGLDTSNGAPEADMMGGASMMGETAMMGETMMSGTEVARPGLDELAAMPADAVFGLVSQTCAACHTQFRAKGR